MDQPKIAGKKPVQNRKRNRGKIFPKKRHVQNDFLHPKKANVAHTGMSELCSIYKNTA